MKRFFPLLLIVLSVGCPLTFEDAAPPKPWPAGDTLEAVTTAAVRESILAGAELDLQTAADVRAKKYKSQDEIVKAHKKAEDALRQKMIDKIAAGMNKADPQGNEPSEKTAKAWEAVGNGRKAAVK